MSRPAWQSELARVNRILYEQRDQYQTLQQAQALTMHAMYGVWGDEYPFEGIQLRYRTDYHTDEDESDQQQLYPRCHNCKSKQSPCCKCKHKVDSKLTKDDDRIQPQPICPALWANPTVGPKILRSRQIQKQNRLRDPRWLRNQLPSTPIQSAAPSSPPPASLQ